MVKSNQRMSETERHPKADQGLVDTPILKSARPQWMMCWHRVCQGFAHLLAWRQSTRKIFHAESELDVREHAFVDVTFSERVFASFYILTTRPY
jgi:hypothetical protein